MLETERFGARVYWALIAVAVLAATAVPLTHPDLPSHLRMGEWMLQNGRVPHEEPIAWTRSGEPYFAYSWLAQLLYTGVWKAAGATGLHVLNGIITLLAALSVVPLARVERWDRGTLDAVTALHLAALAITVPSLRPQALLFIAVPLVAAGVVRLARERSGSAALHVFGGAALAANTHLFFPVTAAPIAYAVAQRGRRIVLFVAFLLLLAGWLFSPYGFRWIEVFRLNFAANPMLGPNSPIGELARGFSVRHAAPVAIVLLGALLASAGAWFGAPPERSRALHLARGVGLIVVSIVTFTFAVRLAAIAWLMLLPFAALGVRVLGSRGARHLALGSLLALLAAIALPSRWRGWSDAGLLRPGIAAAADRRLGPMAHVVRCGPAGSSLGEAQIFARFADGAYLSWALSPAPVSVDTRTIFPDSVAVPERDVLRGAGARELGPWGSAQIVVLRVNDPAVGAVDGDTGWLSLGEVVPASETEPSTAWWARAAWWFHHAGATPLGVVLDENPIDPRRARCPR